MYHYWSLMAKLGKVRVLAELGQSRPSTELAVFKYQAQNNLFFMAFQSSKKKMDFLIPKLIFFSSWRLRAQYKKKRKKMFFLAVQDQLLENT